MTVVAAGPGIPADADRVAAAQSVAADTGGVGGVAGGPDMGRGWFPADVERHRRDAPKYCPACAAPLALAQGGQGLTTEYWTGTDRVFVCFCGTCGWSGDIVLADRVIGHEAAE